MIYRASGAARAQRLITQAAQPVRAGPVGGHGGQQAARQLLEGGSPVRIKAAEQLLNRGPPPGQDLHRRSAARFGQMQSQRPARPAAGPAYQPVSLQAVSQANRARMRQAQSLAQDADRLAGVMSKRYQRGGLRPGQPVSPLLCSLPDPVGHSQGKGAKQVSRT